MLAEAGIDAIEVSANGTSRPSIRAGVNEATFLAAAAHLAARVSVPVVLVGGLRSVGTMNRILNETEIDYLALSRPLIREPELVNRWRRGELRHAMCVSCNGYYRTRGHVCIFNGIMI